MSKTPDQEITNSQEQQTYVIKLETWNKKASTRSSSWNT